MPKLAWVLLPMALYGAWLGVALARRQAPSRHALNVQLSVLLMGYLLATAGLGIFWVANQQLPVFDWHYLFGYGTLALVALHLWFNLPVVWRTLRGGGRAAPAPVRPPRPLPALAGVAALALGIGYLAGAARAPAPAAGPVAPEEDIAAVARFHQHSSLSRTGVFGSAPGFDWGDAPPPFKRYPDAPAIPLDRPAGAHAALSAALQGPFPRSGPLTLAEAGTLLHLSAGITLRRGGQALRAAPSSGGLFPSELYLLARRVQGLAPGIYHYDAEGGRLAGLGPLPASDGVPSASDADATVVLTSIFHRTGYKYRERAWRYAAADAGHLLENLRVAAHAVGLHAVLAPRFDEGRLAGALAVDGVREAPLAVMELRSAGRSALAPAPAAFAPVPAATAGLGATSRIQQATSLRSPTERGTGGIALPAPRPSAMPVMQAIVERRSKRRFTGDAVPLPVLASLLADMRQPAQLSAAVRIHLVVNRVQGLDPGVYRYGPGNVLVRVRSGEFAAAARSAALAQDVIGDAAVVLVLAAERRALLAEGARGYRHAFLEAGMVGERWLLGATARGLGACPVGAFYDDEAAALIGIAAGAVWGLIFVAPELAPGFTPLQLSAGRYLAYGVIAALLIAPSWPALWRLAWAEWRVLAALGLAGNIVYYVLLAAAVHAGGVAMASLVIGLAPMAVTLAGSRERHALPLRRLVPSLLLSAAGLACIGGDALAGAGALAGLLCALGALLSWTLYVVWNSRVLARLSSVSAREWSLLVGVVTGIEALVLAVPAFLLADGAQGTHGTHEMAAWWRFVGVVSAVAILCSVVGNALWNVASRALPLALTGQMIVFETLFGLFYGFLWEARWPTVFEVSAMVLLTGGVVSCAAAHSAADAAGKPRPAPVGNRPRLVD